MNKVFKIGEYKFTSEDEFLLDANIWLYLYPPPSKSSGYATRVYSQAFKEILTAKSKLVLNSTILSEYLNRYCRIEWSARFKEAYPDFKQFRQSGEYCIVGIDAAAYARLMLKHARRVQDEFDGVDISKILSGFEAGEVDFNDGLIAHSCLKNSWMLVTHDGDFQRGEIRILTDNGKLIAACKSEEI